jgi:ankyrin repeat protein
LALRSLVLMALEDFLAICETLLQPMKHDPAWEHHADILYEVCSEHEDFAWSLQKRIQNLAPHSKLAMSAALDLEHFSRTTYHPYTDRVIDDYHRKGHPGIVTVLLIQQFLRFGVVDARVPAFLQCRRDFIKDVSTLMSSNFVVEVSLEAILAVYEDSQLFMPGTLLRHPLIRQDYEELGLNDCLGRSVALRKYDAGITKLEASFEIDPYDCIGRTLLHTACVRDDKETVDALITKGLVWAEQTISGLSPLHIAAIAGHHCFRKLYVYYAQLEDFGIILSMTDGRGRTFFEWAASCGNSRAVETHLSSRKLEWHRSGFLDSAGTMWLFMGSAMTAFELAIRYDRTGILHILRRHLDQRSAFQDSQGRDKVVEVTLRDYQGRTPLWFAAHYKRLHALRILAVNNGTDIVAQDIHGISPLMEASRVGFGKGLDYLLHALSSRTRLWMRDNNDKTAMDLAEENGQPHCVQLLLDWVI